MSGIRVTVTDLDHPTETETREVMDDYVIVCAGECELAGMTMYRKADGTETHVLRVTGVRR